MLDGKIPVSRLLLTLTDKRLDKLPQQLGIDPENWLEARFRYVNDLRLAKVEGIFPDKDPFPPPPRLGFKYAADGLDDDGLDVGDFEGTLDGGFEGKPEGLYDGLKVGAVDVAAS